VNGAAVLAVPARGMGLERADDCKRPVPEGRLLLSPDGRTTLRVGKPTVIGRAPAGPPDSDGPPARPDAIALLEAHATPEIVVERIDAEIAAARMAAAVAGELETRLAQRDAREAQLAGRGWVSARRAPGVAARLLREATRWKPCYVVRHPAAATSEELRQAIAAALPESIATPDRLATPTAPIAKARNRRSAPGSPSTEQTQRHSQG